MNKKHLMRLTIIIFAILFTHIPFFSAQAASSTNVPLDDEIYRDMEFWAAEGLIQSQLSSIKPFARSEVGKQIVRALEKWRRNLLTSMGKADVSAEEEL